MLIPVVLTSDIPVVGFTVSKSVDPLRDKEAPQCGFPLGPDTSIAQKILEVTLKSH